MGLRGGTLAHMFLSVIQLLGDRYRVRVRVRGREEGSTPPPPPPKITTTSKMGGEKA